MPSRINHFIRVSGFKLARRSECLRNVSHVLNLAPDEVDCEVNDGRKRLNIFAEDAGSCDILGPSIYPMARDFVLNARDSGGVALVHCAAGTSRILSPGLSYAQLSQKSLS